MLASSSPRRLALLAQIGVFPASTVSPDIDEMPLSEETPRRLADRLARAKLAAGVLACDGGSLVLAADTVVWAGNRILPKTMDEAAARKCLTLLAGRRHRVTTAVALRVPGVAAPRVRSADSVVGFSRLTAAQIDAYLATGEWQGKAGGYAAQGVAGSFIRFLSGSFSNVVGLPLFEAAQLLRGAGWLIP